MGNMLTKMPEFDKYSPTVSPIVATAVMAIATCTVDTVSAYLMQAYKDDPPLWIKFPVNIAIGAGLDPAVIYRIRKYLYGLLDAGRAYFIAYSTQLLSGRYVMSTFYPCLFFRKGGIIIFSHFQSETHRRL
jgi:hypothetical protein